MCDMNTFKLSVEAEPKLKASERLHKQMKCNLKDAWLKQCDDCDVHHTWSYTNINGLTLFVQYYFIYQ